MISLRTLRHLHRRHLTLVRWMTLALLFMLTASTMPRWMEHAHHDGRESAFMLSSDLTGDLHVKASPDGVPATDSADAHLHYLAAAAFDLPGLIAELRHPALPDSLCPPWLYRHVPQRSPAMPDRPPIA